MRALSPGRHSTSSYLPESTLLIVTQRDTSTGCRAPSMEGRKSWDASSHWQITKQYLGLTDWQFFWSAGIINSTLQNAAQWVASLSWVWVCFSVGEKEALHLTCGSRMLDILRKMFSCRHSCVVALQILWTMATERKMQYVAHPQIKKMWVVNGNQHTLALHFLWGEQLITIIMRSRTFMPQCVDMQTASLQAKNSFF